MQRNIKTFVLDRKNLRLADTLTGAQSSRVIFSLIEIMKENDLDHYRYLLWVLHAALKLAQQDSILAEKMTLALAPVICKFLKKKRRYPAPLQELDSGVFALVYLTVPLCVNLLDKDGA